ncbi:hypothetical protein ACFYN9_16765 [Streptomyces collinus]|uniref:Uncharacterized protein n=1 Tax=Streptomyces violaceochromogenes TaxID=67377 RepID=A0ABU6M6Y9_9ACTN|nr:hypothetical protein [Streptomyces violaceochromogenes]MEC7057568.1 hypothetical protein [Streptomyces violaceochromogenes]GHC53649.1 hypothetical protein GCM10010309_11530 [Streptomyces violaceochromogenes]
MNGELATGGIALAPHRPLARWVARLGTPGAGAHEPGPRRITGPVNDGAERTDARTLPVFQDPAWRRRSVSAHRDGNPAVPALALHHPGRGVTYVELDDHGSPLRAGERGTDLVARIEARWDAPPADPDALHVLAAESLDLRHALLHRLAAETAPPPALFHALPWADLDAVAGNVLALLDGAASVEQPGTELRHWFTPAATRLAGPLAVLERGMRQRRHPAALRHEAASLLTGLLAVRPERIPAPTAGRLALLAERLATRDVLFRHPARVIASRLRTAGPPGRSPSLSLRMDAELPAAANRETDRTYQQSAHDELFGVRAEQTPGGRLWVTLTLPSPSAAGEAWTTAPDGLVAPLVLRIGDSEERRFWVALRSRSDGLLGALDLSAPSERFEVVADEPAVPFAALRSVPADELVPSLRASSNVTLRLWEAAATALPPGHAVPGALRLYLEDITGR